jgi:choline monooxygenase
MTRALTDILSPAELASMRMPIESAGTFPNRAYTSQEFFELERAKIYSRRWVAACFESDIPAAGDAAPFEICGMPLLAVRNPEGRVRVFHNACPYDGCPVVLEPRRGLKQLVVPYHGWIYDFSGRLVAAPYWDGTRVGHLDAFGDHNTSLTEVASGVFLNTVFVHLGDKAPSFASYVEPIERQFDEYDLESLEVALCERAMPLIRDLRRKTNWKTFAENASLNVLHENFVHDLYSLSPEIPRIKSDRIPSFQNIIDGSFLALGFQSPDFPLTYPDFGLKHLGRGKTPPRKACFGTHYPNFYVSFGPEFVEVTYVLPVGPEEVRERQMFLMHPEVAGDADLVAKRRFLAGVFRAASEEDGRITEAVQMARRSPTSNQKFYSPFWDRLHYTLNQMILDDLER